MPSFTRRQPSLQTKTAPLGSISSLSVSTPPLHLLPTGIHSLDDLFGGGIPLNGIWAVLSPDRHTAWSRLIERYWISQGLSTAQKSVIVGSEEECKEVVRGCMWIEERGGGGSESEGEGVEDIGQGKGGTKIAWRYERMKKFQTTVKGSGRELNLMTPIPSDLLDHMEKNNIQKYIDLPKPSRAGTSTSTSSWALLKEVLVSISREISDSDDKTATRLTIHDLGSLDWGNPTSSEIARFVHSLKALIHGKNVSVLLTFPSDLCRNPPPGCRDIAQWTTELGWMLDALIELKGFGDEPTLPPLFHPLHGLISLPKLPTTHHLLPPSFKHSTLLGLAGSGGHGGAGENNLGFRLKRKKFVVETVHLGIEGGTGARRTEPKPELSLVSATTHSQSESHQEQEQGQGPVEGVEKVQGGVKDDTMDQGVDRPRGPKDEKQRKPRAKVRFGGEEELGGGEVQIGGEGGSKVDQGHDHPHASHDHHQNHTHTPQRPMVRHDRPDLYEF